MDGRWRVAFLCRKNSCRSQIAEALGRKLASDVMECYSAGVAACNDIKERAVQMLKKMYGIDMIEEGQRPKLITELPEIDIIVYMGCNVESVPIPCQIEFDWGISDPCGETEERFAEVVREIEENILRLREDMLSGRICGWKKDRVAVDFASVFPFWGEIGDDQRNQIRRVWRMELLRKGRQVYRLSAGCKGLMIVRKGCLRVYMISEEGRDVTLYRLYPGDVCVLSAACLMQEIDFEVLIDAEEDTESVTIPAVELKPIMEENLLMQNFVYKKTAERFSDVMWTVQQILFKRTDQRIAQYLWNEMQRQDSAVISVTHDKLARDIGSVREIVSRLLKHMAEDKILKIGYGKVEILDKNRLREMI